MDDASFAELIEYAKPHVAREHGIPERYAHRLVGSSLSELHDDAKKMAREVGAHDPTERSRDDATGRFTGTENVACDSIELPANRSARPDVVTAERAAELIGALPTERDRGLWATAFYAGLRRGELMALRWRDVDLAGGTIRVERSYDLKARLFVAPKSRSGRRQVPIAAVLRGHLRALAIASRRADPDALVFAEDDGKPLDYDAMLPRVRAAWSDAKIEGIGLHAARHTAASLMIAAGVNVKALSEFLGHASITITLDRYGHLLPGSLVEAATRLDAFLDRTNGRTNGRETNSLQIADS